MQLVVAYTMEAVYRDLKDRLREHRIRLDGLILMRESTHAVFWDENLGGYYYPISTERMEQEDYFERLKAELDSLLEREPREIAPPHIVKVDFDPSPHEELRRLVLSEGSSLELNVKIAAPLGAEELRGLKVALRWISRDQSVNPVNLTVGNERWGGFERMPETGLYHVHLMTAIDGELTDYYYWDPSLYTLKVLLLNGDGEAIQEREFEVEIQ